MSVRALDMVAAHPWAILPEMLNTITSIASGDGEGPEALAAKLGRPLQNTRLVEMRGDVAVVPITGPIFRYANLLTEVSGATSLEVLARDFTAAVENPNVRKIILNIDSPGGQVNGIAEFAQMVRASNKPVVSYVGGMGASAAYWIAAAADQVVVSKTAMVGSIGVVISLDTTKDPHSVEIVSSQSPAKRSDVTTPEGRSQIQARLDALAATFIMDIAAYRGLTMKKILADFGQGDVRMGAEAVGLGMADSVSTLEQVIASVGG